MAEERIPTRSYVIMLIVFIVSWLLAHVVLSIIFPSSWYPFSPVSFFSGIVFISIMMGFLIYRQNLRDERTINISDKAARNGFAFILYATPIAIGGLLGFGAPPESILVLILVLVGAMAVAGISAFYYYRQ
ncbi:MAG: hypothetical protein ACFFCT_13225 [Candidatus Odinarchaeota archaeon]